MMMNLLEGFYFGIEGHVALERYTGSGYNSDYPTFPRDPTISV